MKNQLNLLLIFLFLFSGVFNFVRSQDVNNSNYSLNPECGFDFVLNKEFRKNSEKKDEFFKKLEDFKTGSANKSLSDSLLIIPIVFHVAVPYEYNDDPQGFLAPSKINEALHILNEVFAGERATTDYAPPGYSAPDDFNTNIRFCPALYYECNGNNISLAVTDSVDGNVYNGITYHVYGETNINLPDSLTDLELMHRSTFYSLFPIKDYLNVFINDYGIYGFLGAAIPLTWSMTDPYIILNRRVIGTNSIAGKHEGYSLPHEIGHYFGLMHTWGYPGGCDCDDGFTETANHPEGNLSGFSDINPCTGLYDLPLGNIMNYTPDGIRNHFVFGQDQSMRTVIDTCVHSLPWRSWEDDNYIDCSMIPVQYQPEFVQPFETHRCIGNIDISIDYQGYDIAECALEIVDELGVSVPIPNTSINVIDNIGYLNYSFSSLGTYNLLLTVNPVSGDPAFIVDRELTIIECPDTIDLEDAQWNFDVRANLDFSTGIGVLSHTEINAGMADATAISSSGELLFYTNGDLIWSNKHNICFEGGAPVHLGGEIDMDKGVMALRINDNSFAMIFYQGLSLVYRIVNVFEGLDGETFVDLDPNIVNLFDNTPHFINPLDDTNYCYKDEEDIIDDANGFTISPVLEDSMAFWIITSYRDTTFADRYRPAAIKVRTNPGAGTLSIIEGTASESVIPFIPWIPQNYNTIKLSPNAQYLIYMVPRIGVEFFFFNSSYGSLVINSGECNISTAKYTDVAFSADSRFLYTTDDFVVGGGTKINQIDLHTIKFCNCNINSEIIYDKEANSDAYSPYSRPITSLQEGPDDRIYISHASDFLWNCKRLSVINKPEILFTNSSPNPLEIFENYITYPLDSNQYNFFYFPSLIDAEPDPCELYFKSCDTNCTGLYAFTNLSQGDIHNYHWDFGDGATDTLFNPIHQYANDGTYEVILSYDGCPNTFSQYVDVGITPLHLVGEDTICNNGLYYYELWRDFPEELFTVGGAFQWIIEDDNGVITYLSGGAEVELNSVELVPGSYTLSVTCLNEASCVSTAEMTIIITGTEYLITPVDICQGNDGTLQVDLAEIPATTTNYTYSLDLINEDESLSSIVSNITIDETSFPINIQNLTEGNYQFTITDGTCEKIFEFNIGHQIIVGDNYEFTCNSNSDGYILSFPGLTGYSISVSPSVPLGGNEFEVEPGTELDISLISLTSCTKDTSFQSPIPVSFDYDAGYYYCAENPGHIGLIIYGEVDPNWMNLNGMGAYDIEVDSDEFGYDYIIEDLSPGTYLIYVQDIYGCIHKENIEVESFKLNAVITDVCELNTGEISIINVNMPELLNFEFLWSNGETTPTITNLEAGTYTVTATYTTADTNECIIIDNFIVNSAVEASHTVITSPECSAPCTGKVKIDITGSSAFYTVAWSHDGSVNTVTTNYCIRDTLCAGDYSVTVTDSHGCEDVVEFSLLSTSGNAITDVIFGNVTSTVCGSCTGQVAIVGVVEGNPPPVPTYTYDWENGDTTATATGLCAGLNYVTVTNSIGCIYIASVYIDEALIDLTLNITDVSCYDQCDGEIQVIPAGSCNFTYSWAVGVVSGSNPDSLCAGTYEVTATSTDCFSITGEACYGTDIATIDYPVIIPTIVVDSTIDCNGACDGIATVSVSGTGVAPYTYTWDANAGGQTTATASGLCAGSYFVMVSDANACSEYATVTLGEPAPILFSIDSVVDVSCYGDSNGVMYYNIGGGAHPYDYELFDEYGAEVPFTNFDMEYMFNLPAGNFTIVITDAYDCILVDSFTVGTPDSLYYSVTVSPVSCAGACDGILTGSVTGGTPPYTYYWQETCGMNISLPYTGESSLDSICGGCTINTWVVDSNDCISNHVTEVMMEPFEIIASITGTDSLCPGDYSGSLTAYPGGAFTYLWNTNDTTQTIDSIPTGTYSVTVTYVNGCTAVASHVINELEVPVEPFFQPYNISICPGGNYVLTPTNIYTDETFQWYYNGVPITGAESSSLTVSDSGTYVLEVTSSDGCSITSNEITVSFYPAVIVSVYHPTNPTCYGYCDGTAGLIVGGGTTPYSYAWSSGETTSGASQLCAGFNNVVVTDANGCSDLAIFVLTQPTQVELSYIQQPVSCNGACDGVVLTTPSGGTPGYTHYWQETCGMNISLPHTGESSLDSICGGCTINTWVVDTNDCSSAHEFIVFTDPAPLNISGVVTHVSTYGGSDGAINITVTGGTPPYTYLWSNGAITEDIFGLTAGMYSVKVTDVNGCQIKRRFLIIQPLPLVIRTKDMNTPDCYNQCDGSVEVEVAGGVEPYTYSWSDGQSSQKAENLCSGYYHVVVTDANGSSSVMKNIYVEQPLEIIANISCNEHKSFKMIKPSIVNGNPPYSYLWTYSKETSSQKNIKIKDVSKGNLYLNVIDANGCVKDFIFDVNDLNCSKTESAENRLLERDVHIYPNPTTGLLNIQFNTEENYDGEILLYNMVGEKVSVLYVGEFGSSEIEVDLGELSDGMYYICISTETKTVYKKIILKE